MENLNNMNDSSSDFSLKEQQITENQDTKSKTTKKEEDIDIAIKTLSTSEMETSKDKITGKKEESSPESSKTEEVAIKTGVFPFDKLKGIDRVMSEEEVSHFIGILDSIPPEFIFNFKFLVNISKINKEDNLESCIKKCEDFNGYFSKLSDSTRQQFVENHQKLSSYSYRDIVSMMEICRNTGVSLNRILDVNNLKKIQQKLEWQLVFQPPPDDFFDILMDSDTPQEVLVRSTLGVDKQQIQEWQNRENWPKPVKSHQVTSLREIYGSQEIFNAGMEYAMKEISKGIDQGWRGEKLIHFAAFMRMNIAVEQLKEKGSSASKEERNKVLWYGQPRGGSCTTFRGYMTTGLEGAYAPLDKALAAIKEKEDAREGPPEIVDGCYYKTGFISFKFYITVEGNPEPIELSAYDNSKMFKKFSYLDHTPPDNIEILEKVYLTRLDEAIDTDKNDLIGLQKKLGEFYWYYCQAKPLVAGDPASAEATFKGILDEKGWNVPGFKPGVVPWEEVSKTRSAKEFGENFANLFAGEMTRKTV